MPKKKEAQMPRPKAGDGWVVLWKTPALRDEPNAWEIREPRIIRRPTVTVASVQRGDLSAAGLGAVSLVLSDLQIGSSTASDIAAIAGNSINLGSAQTVDRAWLHAIIEETPERALCRGTAQKIEGIARSLEQARQLPRTTLGAYRSMQDHRWEGMTIALGFSHPDAYGIAFVPKANAEHLIRATADAVCEAHRDLEPSHVLIDLLKTKHELMRELGFTQAVELDQRTILNALKRNAA